MNKLQMVQNMILTEIRRVGICSIDDEKLQEAWNIADKMQAEADKREKIESLDWIKQTEQDAQIYGTVFARFSLRDGNLVHERLDPKLITLIYSKTDDNAVQNLENHEHNYVYGRVCSCGKVKEESNKQKIKCDEKIEINMYPEYDATINYPPDAWVMYCGEKRLAVSIKNEWQPDWSQAPEWAAYWIKTSGGSSAWLESKPRISSVSDSWVLESIKKSMAPSFNYQGDWRDSLRKRPE